MELVNLAIDADALKKKQEAAEAPCEIDEPKYPYGTCLYLNDETLAALGIKEMPPVGTAIKVVAVGRVTGTSEREYESGKHTSLDVQLTDMSLASGKKQTFEESASKLYGKK